MTPNHDNLKAYLDNELSDIEAAKVRQELERDLEAQKAASAMQAIGATLRLVKSHEPQGKADVLDAVIAAQKAPKQPFFARPLYKALAVGGVAVLLFTVFSSSSSKAKNPMGDQSSSVAFKRNAESTVGKPVATAPAAPSAGVSADRAMAAKSVGTSAKLAEPEARINSVIPEAGFAPNGGHEFVRGGGESISPQVSVAPEAAPLQHQRIARTATLGLFVDDVAAKSKEAQQIGAGMGALVNAGSEYGPDGVTGANISFSVDPSRVASLVKQLLALGQQFQYDQTANDVGVQLVDMEARLKSMRAEEESVRSLLKMGRNVNEILTVRDRLSEVRQQIESLDSQRHYLQATVDRSTVSLRLTKRPKEIAAPKQVGFLESTWGDSIGLAGDVAKFLVGLFLHVLALAPIWIPVSFVTWLGYRYAQPKVSY